MFCSVFGCDFVDVAIDRLGSSFRGLVSDYNTVFSDQMQPHSNQVGAELTDTKWIVGLGIIVPICLRHNSSVVLAQRFWRFAMAGKTARFDRYRIVFVGFFKGMDLCEQTLEALKENMQK